MRAKLGVRLVHEPDVTVINVVGDGSSLFYPHTWWTAAKFELPQPASLSELVDSRFWKHQFYNPIDYLWQDAVFQPVGGMDKIVEALVAAPPAPL